MPDPSLIDPSAGHDATVIAIALTAGWALVQFLRKLGDLWLRRLAKKWGVDNDKDRCDE
ncbi:MAG TPA: hypothetical protein VIS06_04155 [Mycobacteriales bacterium]